MTDETTEQTETPAMNLFQRISAIQAKVTTVAKNANVDKKYDAVRHDDVTHMLRPLLVEYGVISFLSMESSQTVDTGVKWKNRTCMQTQTIFIVTYCNIDDQKDTFSVRVEAHADEAGDKSPGKVASYAQKYADLKTFRVATGDDEESRVPDEEVTVAVETLTEEQLIDLSAKAEELFGDDADSVLQSMSENVFRVDSYLNIQTKHYSVALAKLDAKAKAEQ